MYKKEYSTTIAKITFRDQHHYMEIKAQVIIVQNILVYRGRNKLSANQYMQVYCTSIFLFCFLTCMVYLFVKCTERWSTIVRELCELRHQVLRPHGEVHDPQVLC